VGRAPCIGGLDQHLVKARLFGGFGPDWLQIPLALTRLCNSSSCTVPLEVNRA